MTATPPTSDPAQSTARIRALNAADIPAADRIMRIAFGTFVGAPDPTAFGGDASFVRSHALINPSGAYVAEKDGEIVGSNFALRWGSLGFFGPLTVRPDLWDQGVGRRLMEPIVAHFTDWDITLAGLFTFPHSPKHLCLYQKYGFWPRALTAVLSKPIPPDAPHEGSFFSDVPAAQREDCLAACREVTHALYDGLDVTNEIRVAAEYGLGDTVLVWDNDRLAALAVCHCGPGTEGGSAACYVKFGAVRPGPNAERDFTELLDACATLGARFGVDHVTAGVNTARQEAYAAMLNHGFRIEFLGLAMHRPSIAGYSRPGIYALDDLR